MSKTQGNVGSTQYSDEPFRDLLYGDFVAWLILANEKLDILVSSIYLASTVTGQTRVSVENRVCPVSPHSLTILPQLLPHRIPGRAPY